MELVYNFVDFFLNLNLARGLKGKGDSQLIRLCPAINVNTVNRRILVITGSENTWRNTTTAELSEVNSTVPSIVLI